MTAASYSFIDIAALDAVRERFARGDAMVLLSGDLQAALWANGPGAALFGYPDIDALTDGPAPLGAAGRRQLASLSGFPRIGRDRNVAVRLSSGLASRVAALQASTVDLPDGAPAILLAATSQGAPEGAEAARRAIAGIAQPGQFAAMVDATGRVIAASADFDGLGLPQDLLAELVDEAAAAPDRLVKRMVRAGRRSLPAGFAKLTDDAHLLIVVDETYVEMPEGEPDLLEEIEADGGAEDVLAFLSVADAAEVGAAPESADTGDWPAPDAETWNEAAEPPSGAEESLADAAPLPSEPAALTALQAIPSIRFTWRTDAQARVTAVGNEFPAAAGIAMEELLGHSFEELGQKFGFGGGEVGALLRGRDTWSGRTVLWPVAEKTVALPVDLAALPTYDRARRFEGFRGFGVARTADVQVWSEPAGEPAPPVEDAALAEPASPVEAGGAPAPPEPTAQPAPAAAAPAAAPSLLRSLKEDSDRIVKLLSEHRFAGSERSLSPNERNAFREIGERLRKDGDGPSAPPASIEAVAAPPPMDATSGLPAGAAAAALEASGEAGRAELESADPSDLAAAEPELPENGSQGDGAATGGAEAASGPAGAFGQSEADLSRNEPAGLAEPNAVSFEGETAEAPAFADAEPAEPSGGQEMAHAGSAAAGEGEVRDRQEGSEAAANPEQEGRVAAPHREDGAVPGMASWGPASDDAASPEAIEWEAALTGELVAGAVDEPPAPEQAEPHSAMAVTSAEARPSPRHGDEADGAPVPGGEAAAQADPAERADGEPISLESLPAASLSDQTAENAAPLGLGAVLGDRYAKTFPPMVPETPEAYRERMAAPNAWPADPEAPEDALNVVGHAGRPSADSAAAEAEPVPEAAVSADPVDGPALSGAPAGDVADSSQAPVPPEPDMTQPSEVVAGGALQPADGGGAPDADAERHLAEAGESGGQAVGEAVRDGPISSVTSSGSEAGRQDEETVATEAETGLRAPEEPDAETAESAVAPANPPENGSWSVVDDPGELRGEDFAAAGPADDPGKPASDMLPPQPAAEADRGEVDFKGEPATLADAMSESVERAGPDGGGASPEAPPPAAYFPVAGEDAGAAALDGDRAVAGPAGEPDQANELAETEASPAAGLPDASEAAGPAETGSSFAVPTAGSDTVPATAAIHAVDARPAAGDREQAREPEALDVQAPAALEDAARPLPAAAPAEAEPRDDAASAPVGDDRGEALPQAEGRPETPILDRIPIPVLIHAGDVLHYANAEFLALAAYPSLDALVAAGGLGGLFTAPWERAGGDDDRRLRLRTALGEELPVDALLRTVPWNGGKALLLVLRRIEGEPPPGGKRPESDLEQRVSEMRAIIDTATDGVVLMGPDSVIRSISRPAEALFGLDGDKAAGLPFGALFAVESQRAVADYLDGLADNGVASVLNDGREVIGREAGGGFIPLFMTIGKLPENGGFCAVMRDITQWKRAEEELTQSRALAERASSHKTDFLARVSHEIRTPLNAIIGFSELMLDEKFGPVGSDRYRDYLRDINRSGNHVLDLVNDLLDISKIEAGQQDMSYEAVSLNDALGETVATMQPQANRERVIIRSSFAARLPDVVADPRSIRQIALNILSNALRFTQAGGQVIVSTAHEPSGDVAMRVRDTGIGMSPAEIEQALKPFKQINSLRRTRGDGTGLGLPLTKAMVEANRARFTISSTPGEGTLVEIVFPSTRVLAG